MASLNFKHLRYFWMVAKSGSIAGASKHLHLTPQSISGQLGELEASLGVELFRRVGRGLELTETGRRIFSYADGSSRSVTNCWRLLSTRRRGRACRFGLASPIRCRSRWPIAWSNRRCASPNRYGWSAARAGWRRCWPKWRSTISIW